MKKTHVLLLLCMCACSASVKSADIRHVKVDAGETSATITWEYYDQDVSWTDIGNYIVKLYLVTDSGEQLIGVRKSRDNSETFKGLPSGYPFRVEIDAIDDICEGDDETFWTLPPKPAPVAVFTSPTTADVSWSLSPDGYDYNYIFVLYKILKNKETGIKIGEYTVEKVREYAVGNVWYLHLWGLNPGDSYVGIITVFRGKKDLNIKSTVWFTTQKNGEPYVSPSLPFITKNSAEINWYTYINTQHFEIIVTDTLHTILRSIGINYPVSKNGEYRSTIRSLREGTTYQITVYGTTPSGIKYLVGSCRFKTLEEKKAVEVSTLHREKLGLEEEELQRPTDVFSIHPYPNPVTDLLTFETSSAAHVRVLDMKGAEMFIPQDLLPGKNTMDLRFLPAGIYLLEITDPLTIAYQTHTFIKK